MAINQYKVGASLSYVSIFLTNVIGLVLTPFIIRSLGDSEYGLYSLIGSFVAYLSLMDLGLNNTIVRFVSKYRAEGNTESERKFLGTTMMIYGFISVFVILIGLVMYLNLDNVFSKSLTVDQLSRANIMFLILIFNVAITLPGGSFIAICNSYERFVFPRTLNILRYLLRAATVIFVLAYGGKAIALVLIDTAFNLLVFIASSTYVSKKLKVKFDFSERNWGAIRPIFSYSVWIFIVAIVQTFQWNVGQLILGINTNTLQVGVFAVGIMLGTYYGAFAGVINSLLLPKANKLVVGNCSPDQINLQIIRVARLCNITSFLILSGFFLFGRDFIFLWIGKQYNDSWFVALLIMIVLTIPLSQSLGNSIIEAKNKVKFKSIFSLLSMFIGSVLGYLFSKDYGIWGVIIPLCSALLINTIVLNIYFVKVFSFDPRQFYSQAYFRQFLFVSLFSFLMWCIKRYLVFDSWIMLAQGIVVYVVCYCLLYYFVLLNIQERKLLIPRK